MGADAKSLPGITQPFPQLFDPFNLLGNAAGTKDGVNEVKRWREAELTHGRVAMLAALGFITQEQILGANAPRPFPHVSGETTLSMPLLLGSGFDKHVPVWSDDVSAPQRVARQPFTFGSVYNLQIS